MSVTSPRGGLMGSGEEVFLHPAGKTGSICVGSTLWDPSHETCRNT